MSRHVVGKEAEAWRGATSDGLIVLGVGALGRRGLAEETTVFSPSAAFLLNLSSIPSGRTCHRHLFHHHHRRHTLLQVSQVVVAVVEARELAVTG